jgi:phage shock protein PspC (stress-responsive transcriptional regulator)
MPSLIRILVVIGIIGGIGYAAIYALATLVDPKPRDMTITVSPDRFVKQH